MPSSPQLASWLVDRGHDAVHASAIGLATAPDIEIIAIARRDGRTIITSDLDYPRLLAIARSIEPSLILFRGGDWSEADVRSRMSALLRSFSTADITGSILVVDRDRVRRRRLPVP